MTSLTREAARIRSRDIAVDGYDIDLDLTLGEQYFGSVTSVRFRRISEAHETFVDVAPSELRRATLNGAAVETAFDAATGRLRLGGLADDNVLVVDAVMAYSHDGEGLHRHVDPADGRTYLYAMSFLDAAPRWFACFDQPDLKAPVRLDVRCDPDWVVQGNGPATRLAPGRWAIAATRPLATYFTTLVAGPYHLLQDEHDGITLHLLARQSLADHLDRDAEELFGHTKHCLDELHALFGVRYPWGEYGQAFVPEFNAGAMENPGCVTFRDTLVFRSRATESERLDRLTTVAHEMAHMWFGDLVTMRWWDDLWLNESFAEYLGTRVTGDAAWVDFGIARKSWGYAADRRPSTHPVAGNGAADAASALMEFDGISYAKGASALRQLALQLGDDVFLDGLRRYIRAHQFGNAEFADLVAAWADAGATELDAWTSAWLRTTGLDELSVVDGTVRRAGSASPRPHSVTVAAFGADGAELAARRIAVTAESTPTGLPAADLLLPDARDETWAKLVLPASAWRTTATFLPGVADARTRTALWTALQLAVADAELDPRTAVDVVAAALPAETDDAVIGVVGRWARRPLIGCYLPAHDRTAAQERLAAAMLEVAHAARPGSSRQLAAARTVIAFGLDAHRLRAWLAGAELPDGLVLDAELRWSTLHRLAALGELDDAGIVAEAERDRSSQGAVHAARCRAARPDPAAKEAAWAALTTDPDRPNYELYALAEGFWEPDQADLTAPWAERYFDEIPATAQLRSGWVVERLAALAYPWTAVEPSTIVATQRLLARDDIDQNIRRSVVDAGDDLRRAVEVRQRFG